MPQPCTPKETIVLGAGLLDVHVALIHSTHGVLNLLGIGDIILQFCRTMSSAFYNSFFVIKLILKNVIFFH